MVTAHRDRIPRCKKHSRRGVKKKNYILRGHYLQSCLPCCYGSVKKKKNTFYRGETKAHAASHVSSAKHELALLQSTNSLCCEASSCFAKQSTCCLTCIFNPHTCMRVPCVCLRGCLPHGYACLTCIFNPHTSHTPSANKQTNKLKVPRMCRQFFRRCCYGRRRTLPPQVWPPSPHLYELMLMILVQID